MDVMIEEMLEMPYWIIDVLPKRVPADGGGRFFAVEEFFLGEDRMGEIKRRHIDLILKLNCYCHVTFLDVGHDEGYDEGADEGFVELSPREIDRVMRERALYIMVDEALIYSEPDCLNMTLYGPGEELLELVRTIAAGEGLFVWNSVN